MRRIGCCGLLLVGLLVAVPPLRADDKPAADEPAVVIRVKSLDTVLANLKLLATVVGREQNALDLQGLIKAKVGDKGLQGIDMKRPVRAVRPLRQGAGRPQRRRPHPRRRSARVPRSPHQPRHEAGQGQGRHLHLADPAEYRALPPLRQEVRLCLGHQYR